MYVLNELPRLQELVTKADGRIENLEQLLSDLAQDLSDYKGRQRIYGALGGVLISGLMSLLIALLLKL